MIGIIFLFALLILLIFLVFWYYFSFLKALYLTKSPYVGSFQRQLELMKQLDLEKWKTIVDLGCWDGKVLRFFEKEFWLKWIWYDLNSFAIIWWRLLNKIKKSDIKLFKWDFTKQDISKFDYIFMYLMPSVMKELEGRVFENKWENSIVIVNTFPFPNKKPFKVIWWKIFLYK
jgi:ubiquinone/menaquinone biosynthesis C-methylase UbiE